MEISHLMALSIFTSYFLTIIGLFFLIIQDLRLLAKTSNAPGPKKTIFVGLTIASFAHTWFYMIQYMSWSFADYGRALPKDSQDLLTQIASWLRDTSLFEQAWSIVCFNSLNWWWSEQLCLFTVGAWTIFLVTEGSRLRIKHLWAYMLLGQIVAISVSANLFYLAVLLTSASGQNEKPSKSVSPRVWLSVFVSLATIAASPFTSKKTFLPNLLVMHALLFIPLVTDTKTTSDESRSPYSMNTRTLFNVVYITSASIHIKTILTASASLHPTDPLSPRQLAKTAWRVLHSHPAQSSIGWDVVWTTISFTVWIAARPTRRGQHSKYLSIPYLTFASPLASIGVTAPYILQPRGEEAESNTKADKFE